MFVKGGLGFGVVGASRWPGSIRPVWFRSGIGLLINPTMRHTRVDVGTKDDGSLTTPASFTRWVQKQAKEIGFETIGVQGIRHTWATTALRLNIHPKIVQERLGHASISTTLNIYSHARPEMQEQAAQEVAEVIMAGLH